MQKALLEKLQRKCAVELHVSRGNDKPHAADPKNPLNAILTRDDLPRGHIDAIVVFDLYVTRFCNDFVRRPLARSATCLIHAPLELNAVWSVPKPSSQLVSQYPRLQKGAVTGQSEFAAQTWHFEEPVVRLSK